MEEIKCSISTTNSDIIAMQKDWDEISCPICLDHPHNAVLLICKSHEKGCRSFICDTSYRHSNCLDRFKKLTVNLENNSSLSTEQHSDSFLTNPIRRRNSIGKLNCPLCRETVSGLMIVRETRQYLDLKPRSCSRELCSFSGNYRELRRHARRVHPATRPADIDPSRQRAWRRLENEREYGDILSSIRSAMPGAVVLGDYVIDSSHDPPYERYFGEDRESRLTSLFLPRVINSSFVEPLDEPRGFSRLWRLMNRRSYGHHRTLWDQNLLGLQGDDDEGDDLNPDDDIMMPRRRRRFT